MMVFARSLAGLLFLALGSGACATKASVNAHQENEPLTGVWKVDWCDNSAPAVACGVFRVYLAQIGTRICGTHYGADANANRLDEGEPRSILGAVVEKTAVLAITSARNHGIYLVTAKREGDRLDWKITETIKEGSNGEPALISDGDQLSRSTAADDLRYLQTVRQDCAKEGAGDGKPG